MQPKPPLPPADAGGLRARIGHDFVPALACLCLVCLGLALVWAGYLPNRQGLLGEDYSMWLPNLLAGEFWHLNNGFWSVPWFNPAQCGGIPVQADPQGEYFSLAQFLTFFVPPMRAVQTTFFVFAAIGFLGCFILGRAHFALSRPAALLAATVFALNSFYAGRMVAGHLSFSPFMLLPLATFCLLGPVRGPLSSWILRCGAFAIVVGIMLEGGMLVVIPVAYLSLLMLVFLHAVVTQKSPALPLLRLSAGTALGLLLCAGKLAAVLSLMSHVPRDAFTLPGYLSIGETAWVAFRALFFGPAGDMSTHLANGVVLFQRHEFEYSVGPACLALLLASAADIWRKRDFPKGTQRLCADTLILLLLVPLALNTYGAGWTHFLKTLPVIRDSSSLLRYFAAYILPACLGAAGSLDRLAAGRLRPAWGMASAAAAATLATLLLADHSAYGPVDIGRYDPRTIEASWHAVSASRAVPPVRDIGVLRDAQGQVDKIGLARQDSMTIGQSQLFCYDALFGYALENLPFGTLHPGSVFDRTPRKDSGAKDGGIATLNIKNPACYVFPAANGCKPGDAFTVSQIDQATKFADYKPFSWRKPGWAYAADWAGYILWPLTVMTLLGTVLLRAWPRWRKARTA